MSGGSRSLPVRPSLRFLKLAAKRRLAAGEFTTLHDAQAAIAREHGLPSWAALKQVCALASEPESHALDHLHWVISRFSGADAPGWTAPDSGELREHFDDRFLAVIPARTLVEQASKMAADLRAELVVLSAGPLEAVVQLAGLRYYAAADATPPHRLIGLRGFPLGDRIAGLWSTGADLVRLGTGWSLLLPAALAREALTAQAGPGVGGLRTGLGWLLAPGDQTAMHGGAGLDGVALLRSRVRDGRTHVVLTSRTITVESVDNRLLHLVTNPATHR